MTPMKGMSLMMKLTPAAMKTWAPRDPPQDMNPDTLYTDKRDVDVDSVRFSHYSSFVMFSLVGLKLMHVSFTNVNPSLHLQTEGDVIEPSVQLKFSLGPVQVLLHPPRSLSSHFSGGRTLPSPQIEMHFPDLSSDPGMQMHTLGFVMFPVEHA
jgi:hypothetical protein